MTLPLYGTSDFMKLWQQSSQAAEFKLQKFLAAGLDEYVRAQSDLMAEIPSGLTFTSPVLRWFEEEGYPDRITGQLATATLTFTGNLFGAALTEANLSKVIRVGTYLQRPSDGKIWKVTSISGITDSSAPWTCTIAAHGNCSVSDDTGPITYRILGEGWTDNRDIDTTRSLERSSREVGTQIFAETFEIPETRKNTKYEIIDNEIEHQLGALYEKMKRQLAYALFCMEPYYNSGYKFGNQVEDSAMCSFRSWGKIGYAEDANADCYKDMSSTALTRTALDTLIRKQYLDRHANYNQGNWAIVCHPEVHKLIAAMDLTIRQTSRTDKGVGVNVDYFDAQVGKRFPVKSDPYILDGDLWVVNLAAGKYGYYANDKLHRKEISTKGRYQQWLISMQAGGVQLRNPKKNFAMMYGIVTT